MIELIMFQLKMGGTKGYSMVRKKLYNFFVVLKIKPSLLKKSRTASPSYKLSMIRSGNRDIVCLGNQCFGDWYLWTLSSFSSVDCHKNIVKNILSWNYVLYHECRYNLWIVYVYVIEIQKNLWRGINVKVTQLNPQPTQPRLTMMILLYETFKSGLI